MGWAWLGLIRLSKLFHREHTGARRGLDPEELNVLCNSYQSGLSIAEVSICQVESTLSSLQKACLLTSFGRVCHMFHHQQAESIASLGSALLRMGFGSSFAIPTQSSHQR